MGHRLTVRVYMYRSDAMSGRLLTNWSIKLLYKMIQYQLKPLNWNWTLQINRGRKSSFSYNWLLIC